MNEGAVFAVALISSVLAGLAVAVSILVLRRVSAAKTETSRLGDLLDFATLEGRRGLISRSVSDMKDTLKGLKADSSHLGADLSKAFAGIASVLNETHRLEGNPHPKLDTKQLRELNEKLLAIGESSLSATRIAENLAAHAEELASRVHDLEQAVKDLRQRPPTP